MSATDMFDQIDVAEPASQQNLPSFFLNFDFFSDFRDFLSDSNCTQLSIMLMHNNLLYDNVLTWSVKIVSRPMRAC